MRRADAAARSFTRAFARAAFALSVCAAITAGCSAHHPPSVTHSTHESLDPSEQLFVVADRQREAIVGALERAGFSVTTDLREVGYSVEARVGASRGGGDCGEVRNVIYTVVHHGQKLLEIKGRGATGDCNGNIFDAVAAVMAGYRR